MSALVPAPATAPDAPTIHSSLPLAAEAVLARLCGRAPARFTRVTLGRPLEYAVPPDPAALVLHRSLLEDLVGVRLAGAALREMLGQGDVSEQAGALEFLKLGLAEPEEREVAHAHLCVLMARTKATLRRHWPAVQVVAAGLREQGELDFEAVSFRMSCAGRISAQLYN